MSNHDFRNVTTWAELLKVVAYGLATTLLECLRRYLNRRYPDKVEEKPKDKPKHHRAKKKGAGGR